MFNLSGSELIFLVIIALVVLGPDKLPEAMRKAGKAYADFKKMTTGFQSEMKSVLDEPMRELRETAELAKNSAMFDTKPFTDSLKDLGNTVTQPATKPAKPTTSGAAPPVAAPAEVAPAKASRVTTSPVVVGGATSAATIAATATDTTDATKRGPADDAVRARRLARATPPAIDVSTTQVPFGESDSTPVTTTTTATSAATDTAHAVALWPVEPPAEIGEVPA